MMLVRILLVTLCAFMVERSFANATIVDGVEWHYEIVGGYASLGCNEGYLFFRAVRTDIEGDIVVPSVLGGYEVGYVGQNAFMTCYGITSISLPETVREIGPGAFSCCRSLKTVVLPRGLKKIGRHAFQDCLALTAIEIPSTVDQIDGNPFVWCQKLWDITVASGNARYYFADGVICDRVTRAAISCRQKQEEVSFPADLKAIGEEAFSGCQNITEVHIPDGVETIGAEAFCLCQSLNELTLSQSLKNIEDGAFDGCESLVDVIDIPAGVTNIGANAFCGCSYITEVRLPKALVSLGERAFEDCERIETIQVPDGLTIIPDSAFAGCSALGHIDLPKSLVSIGPSAFEGAGATTVVMRAGLKEIGERAFCGCRSLSSLDLPAGLETIGDRAFYMCKALSSVVVPARVSSMGNRVFEFCSKLSAVTYLGDQPIAVGDAVYVNTPATLVSYVDAGRSGWKTELGKGVWRDRAITTSGGNVIEYVVTFDVCGGEGEALPSLSLARGTKIGALPTPVRAGYDFLGWYTDLNGDVAVNPELEVTEDLHLLARWEKTLIDKLYMVIHLDAGRDADSYPVTYLADVPEGGWSDEYKTSKLVLRRIEPGSFKMGGERTVTLSTPYYIGIFETTIGQCERICGQLAANYQEKSDVRGATLWVKFESVKGAPKCIGEDVPISENSFLGKLRSKTGLAFDLPTEAQWEYACRAGTTSRYNNGGDTEKDFEKVGWSRWNGYLGYEVGLHLPNAWGLYDMHGGVWEVCSDYYGERKISEGCVDPHCTRGSDMWVIRGGGRMSTPEECTSSFRTGVNAGGFAYVDYQTSTTRDGIPIRNYTGSPRGELGFRICLNIPEEARKVCTVRIDYNHDNRVVAEISRVEGTPIGRLASPERAGYRFCGWHKTSPEGDCLDENYVVSSDMTIYAKWEKSEDVLHDGLYAIIDLSGGPDAVSYPVSYRDDVPAEGWTDEYKTEKIVLRKIPAGTFDMGDLVNDENVCGNITLSSAFYMGVFEVTQRQWELVTGKRPSYCIVSKFYTSRPVENVSYEDIRGATKGLDWPASDEVDASSFMGLLRSRTGLRFDLPTDAQWEYACRAGTKTDFNNGVNLANPEKETDVPGRTRYNSDPTNLSCGLSATQLGVSLSTPTGCTAFVGSYEPNAFGLYDMHGNVSEWCLDWWRATGSPSCRDGDIDPLGPDAPSTSSNQWHVCRGGSYRDALRFCTSHYRFHPFQTRWTYLDGSSKSVLFAGLRLCLTTQPLVSSKSVIVTFDSNGGSCGEAVRTIRLGDSVGDLPTPVREGYDFLGWYENRYWAPKVSCESKPGADVVYYAHWVESGFVPNVGSCEQTAVSLPYSRTERTASGRLTNEYNWAIPGYFSGEESCVYYWKVEVPVGCGLAAWIDEPNEDVHMIGIMSERHHTIIREWSDTMNYVVATKQGDCTSEVFYLTIEGPLGDDVTLHYQCFNEKDKTTYTIRYAANGGVDEMGDDDVFVGELFELSLCDFNKPGHAFQGWSLSRNGAVRFRDGECVRNLAAAGAVVTLYAVWDDVQPHEACRVVFDPQGGTCGEDARWLSEGDVVGSLPTPTWRAHKFDGWYTAVSGGTKVMASTKVTTDVTYYAHWTYDGLATVSASVGNGCAEGGAVSGGKTAKAGSKVTLKATAKPGYVFAGWYLDEALTLPAEGSVDYRTASFPVVSNGMDQKLYARFLPSTVDLNVTAAVADSYDLNGTWTKKLDIDSLSLPSVTMKGLPAGLKFDAKTLTVYGTPTKPGSYTVTLSLKNMTVKVPKTQAFVLNVANIQSPYLAGVNYAPNAYVYRCGVSVGWDIGACARDGYVISGITGLPTGLKYNTKTGRVEGVPTKAGSFTATIALKNGKLTSSATVSMMVDAINVWAYGTFSGGSPSNQVQLVVSNTGKLSGKLFEDGLTYSLAATAYSAYDADTMSYWADVIASWSYKEGRKIVKTNEIWTIEVVADSIGGVAGSDRFCAWQNVWTQKAWKDFGVSFFGKSGTIRTLSGEAYSLGEGESVTLTIKPNGAVTVKGVFNTGVVNRKGSPVYYSASGSAVVCVTSAEPFAGQVFVYFAPNAGKSFGGYVRVVSVRAE